MKKRKWLFILAVLSCIILIGSTALASTDQHRGMIRSKGIIDYANGKVIIDASDLTSLADQMDKLEISYKTALVDSLAQIGTYMQTYGSIDHRTRADIDPQRIRYEDFVTGIEKSQSVIHLVKTQAADTHGLVYYKFEKNNILEVTDKNTGMPVYIAPAITDNLSEQTAAWIDGQCMEGNGADNYYFYQKGFIEGYAAKIGAEVKYTYDDSGRIKSADLIIPE